MRRASVGIDDQKADTTGRFALAMRIDMKPRVDRYTRIEHDVSHQLSPQQCAPVVWSGRQRVLVQQAVIACRKRVVYHDLNAGLRQPAKLVEISERIQKGCGPAVSAARCLRGLGQPDRLAGFELVAKGSMESQGLIRPRQPLFGKSGLGCTPTAASLRQHSIVMIRKYIHAAGAGCNEKVRNRGGVAGRAGTKDDHPGKVFLHKRMKHVEVTSVSAGIIAGRRTTYRSEVRLVHELRGGDAAADRAGIGEEAARLVRLPDAGRIAGAWAYRE